MNPKPDFQEMTEQERAEWHEAHADVPRKGRVVKRQTRTTADIHLSVRLYPDQIARLKRLSAIEGRSVSALVRRIVEEELDRRLPAQETTSNVVAMQSVFDGTEPMATGSSLPEVEIHKEVAFG